MKGIVFNVLEDAVVDQHGDGAWDEILASAGAEGAYTALGNYPDEELMRLVDAACSLLGASRPEVLRWFGGVALPALAERYPEFVAAHDSAKSFLLSLDHTIHREVVKLYPDARPPRFVFEDTGDDRLVMQYFSERRLCAMAEGMIEATADHFGARASVDHTDCMHRGARNCTLAVTFS